MKLAAPLKTWLARGAFAVIGIGFAALAIFFLAFAVIVGAVVAMVFGARLWWVMRKVKAARKAAGPIEGDYTVVERSNAGERLR